MAEPATLSQEYSLIRPASISGQHAPTRPCRSISSASPPAVGNTSTGVPKCPHRAMLIGYCNRSEYHRSVVFTRTVSPTFCHGVRQGSTGGKEQTWEKK